MEFKMNRGLILTTKDLYMLVLVIISCLNYSCAGQEKKEMPLRVAVDLNIGEKQEVRLCNGEMVFVNLISISDSSDELTSSIRLAKVKISIDGEEVQLNVANYNLPLTVGKVKVDCPVTKAYPENSKHNRWKLEKDARLRLWPKDSLFIAPNTYVYPLRQRFFANLTQAGNEPVYVNGGDVPGQKSIYYHSGIDFGGYEGKDQVLSPVDGIVVRAGKDSLEGFAGAPGGAEYDALWIQDHRGWFHGFYHILNIDSSIFPGAKVRMGQKIGLLGKEGASGGWSHLHYTIKSKQPSGKWGEEDAWPYIWEAYTRQHKPPVVAVARPHILVQTGKTVILDGNKSKSMAGEIVSFDWLLSDGTWANGPVKEKTYAIPGTYSEVLKVTDSEGNIDYDFAVVQVISKEEPAKLPPAIHAVYYPTMGIKAGGSVTFGVRTFRTGLGHEEWDFGDGSEKVIVKSVVPEKKKEGKYAETVHRFENPGHYLVRVERTDENGYKATAHLHVEVEGLDGTMEYKDNENIER